MDFKFDKSSKLAGIHSSHLTGLRSLGFVFYNMTECEVSGRSMVEQQFITYVSFRQLFEHVRKTVLFTWELLAFGLVLFMQISLIFFESGSVSTKTT